MAFSLGSLIGAMSTGRTQALRGQREQRQLDAEAKRQNRLDLFNEYARSRQLAQTDNAQQNAMERLRDQIEARETIAARDAQIKDFQAKEQARLRQETLNRESGMDPANPTQGYRGADRTSREEMNAARIAAAAAAAAARVAQGGGARSDRNVNQLAGQFRQNPSVKTGYATASALSDIQVGLNQNNAFGDLQAVYGIIKMFDPQSVVREGEIKLTRSANSLPGRVRLIYENWTRGRMITPEMRQQMQDVMDEQVRAKESLIRPVQAEFGAQARARGVAEDSSFIAPSPFSGLQKNSPPPPPPAGAPSRPPSRGATIVDGLFRKP